MRIMYDLGYFVTKKRKKPNFRSTSSLALYDKYVSTTLDHLYYLAAKAKQLASLLVF